MTAANIFAGIMFGSIRFGAFTMVYSLLLNIEVSGFNEGR